MLTKILKAVLNEVIVTVASFCLVFILLTAGKTCSQYIGNVEKEVGSFKVPTHAISISVPKEHIYSDQVHQT